jgi:hypothetical protein
MVETNKFGGESPRIAVHREGGEAEPTTRLNELRLGGREEGRQSGIPATRVNELWLLMMEGEGREKETRKYKGMGRCGEIDGSTI